MATFDVLQKAIEFSEKQNMEPIEACDVFNADKSGFDRNIGEKKMVVGYKAT